MHKLQQATASGVKQIITTILCSHRNKTVKHASLTVLLTKCSNNCDKQLRNNTNVMQMCMQMFTSFNLMQYMFVYVNVEHHKRVVLTDVENCCRVFHVLVKNGMIIRSNEIQRARENSLHSRAIPASNQKEQTRSARRLVNYSRIVPRLAQRHLWQAFPRKINLACRRPQVLPPGQLQSHPHTISWIFLFLLTACCCLLLQHLIHSCARGGRRIVQNMSLL